MNYNLTIQTNLVNLTNPYNKNCILFGGCVSGKTTLIEADILRMEAHYIIMDHFGDIYKKVGKILSDNGYMVQVVKESADAIDIIKQMSSKKKIAVFVTLCATSWVTSIENTSLEGKICSDLLQFVRWENDHHKPVMMEDGDIPIRFVIDEMCNIGEIPKLSQNLIGLSKHDNVSVTMATQSLEQIEALYPATSNDIIASCGMLVSTGNLDIHTMRLFEDALYRKFF